MIDIYLQMEYNGRREAETDGGFQRYVLIQHVLGGIIRERIGKMPKKPREMERIILADGWIFKTQVGSHKQYVHPVKKGRVTIPFHCRDLTKGVENSILKQAKLK